MAKLLDIAKHIQDAGGESYYVGGYVRDELLGKASKDIDIEIHNISESDLLNILHQAGIKTELVGESFGVYKAVIDGDDFDFSFPRRERSTGEKHTDFEIVVDPFMGTKEASTRRDFTFNSIMKNVMTNELVDHHNGKADLEAGIIRHVSDQFAEDPLRVFRAAQFASRFNFDVADETKALCRTIPLDGLARERVETEFKKAITKSNQPSQFFDVLREITHPESIWFAEVDGKDTKIIDKYADSPNAVNATLFHLMPETYQTVVNETDTKRFMTIHSGIHDCDMTDIPAVCMFRHQTTDFTFEYMETTLGHDVSEMRQAYEKALPHLPSGQDLLELGHTPGKEFGETLRKAQVMVFAGMNKDDVLAELNPLAESLADLSPDSIEL